MERRAMRCSTRSHFVTESLHRTVLVKGKTCRRECVYNTPILSAKATVYESRCKGSRAGTLGSYTNASLECRKSRGSSPKGLHASLRQPVCNCSRRGTSCASMGTTLQGARREKWNRSSSCKTFDVNPNECSVKCSTIHGVYRYVTVGDG